MFVAANRFRVIPAEAAAFEAMWLSRESHLHEVPGFVSFRLLRGPAQGGPGGEHVLYSSWTLWESKDAFEGWTRSEQFRRAHAGAGGAKATTIGPPQFEGFEVIQHIGREG